MEKLLGIDSKERKLAELHQASWLRLSLATQNKASNFDVAVEAHASALIYAADKI